MSIIQLPFRRNCFKQLLTVCLRYYSNEHNQSPPPTTPLQKEKATKSKIEQQEVFVAGLSSKVYSVPNEEVGSGASKNGNYKNPEYFCYNSESYFEAEIEMLKFRLPQPSAK